MADSKNNSDKNVVQNSFGKYQNRLKEICENYKTDPQKILEFMQFKSRFYEYSLKNTIMIFDQRPGATFVQSFDKWNKMNTRINKGEHGIKIFVPVHKRFIYHPEKKTYLPLSEVKKKNPELYKMAVERPELKLIEEGLSFRLGNVFDISQTDYPKEKYPQLLHVGYRSEQHDQLIKGVMDFAQKDLKVNISTENLESISVRGISYSDGRLVKMNNLLESTQYLSTLNHEIGHQLMHNREDKIPTSVKEFEADAFAIMLDWHMGIDVLDTRKDHFVQAYKGLRQNPEYSDKSFEELFENVFQKYSANIGEIDKRVQPYINKDISRRAKHYAKEVPVEH